ncbi:MAG TPA: protein kinase [Bryobacteraceae bacterium]|nr:protein kinase [Bryobacteraceae bacterium]
MTGRRISHYEVLEKLGEGGMGTVYKGRDTRLERFVALKFLSRSEASDVTRSHRFIDEARAASALNHPNIVTVYDIGDFEGNTFIAMEYVPGQTLDELIPRKGMRLNEALRYAVQIADALARAHAAGIVHRDLKPGNIMVTPDGTVKVLDFGLAKLTDAAAAAVADDGLTRTLRPRTEEGAIVGTAAYMSPEQAEGRPLDGRSDVFSFGSVLYEMVTGRRAFEGTSKMSTAAAILRAEPAPPEGVPYDLEKIVARCLRKDPARRWQTFADLRVALLELKDESDSGKLSAPAGVPAPRRPRPLLWAGTALALLTLAAAGWWGWRLANRPLAPIRTLPLTSLVGDEDSPALSPDGSIVAFRWQGPGDERPQIYVQQIENGTPLRRTSDATPKWAPQWSPDGSLISFVRGAAQGKGEIVCVPALGGPERLVGATSAFLPAPTWSPDGKHMVVLERREPPQRGGDLYLLSVETGERKKLFTLAEGRGMGASGIITPEGDALIVRTITPARAGDLYLVPLGPGYTPSGEPQPLTSDGAVLGAAVLPGRRGVLFSSQRGGIWKLLPGTPAEKVTDAEADGISVSRNGERVVYAEARRDTNIWRLDLDGRQPPAPFISSTREDAWPEYSPDGRSIAFISTRSGSHEIWVADGEGNNAVRVTRLDGRQCRAPRWSPDGQWLAFEATTGEEPGIHVVRASGGAPRRLTAAPAAQMLPSWSRDGQWIYFSSPTGQHNIWKAPAGGGPAIQVTRDGGCSSPREGPDGSLYMLKSHARSAGLWRVPLSGGPEEPLVPEGMRFGSGFALCSKGAAFVSTGEPVLRFFDFETRRARTVAASEKVLTGGVALSPDGRYLLYTQVDASTSDLILIDHFR